MLLTTPCPAQEEYEITIETTLADTTETFWLQIPADYVPGNPCPLLIGWHQWSADHWEMKYSTEFDSIANARGWIAAAPHGTSRTHWTNQPTQSHVVDVIQWIEAHYSVDADRIYMVGASMGGAAGMVFSNNHLDPAGPMVAAAASISGIQDCERRFHEQGINYSMIEAFGGTPEEVPHAYHRNSAIYFADPGESMHFNACHLPLLLTFGQGTSDLVWRQHAEDLYLVMNGLADHVWLHESAIPGHGWGCAEEALICDFLESFVLKRFPTSIAVNADEEGRWYWADLEMRTPDSSFARFEGLVDCDAGHVEFSMLSNVARAQLDLVSLGFAYDRDWFSCQWAILDESPARLAFGDVPHAPGVVTRDGTVYEAWSYDPGSHVLELEGVAEACYGIFFDAATVSVSVPRQLDVWPVIGGQIGYEMRLGGTLVWEFYDPAGRRRGRGVTPWRAAGRGVVSLPASLEAGIYLAVLRSGAAPSEPRVCKVTVVR